MELIILCQDLIDDGGGIYRSGIKHRRQGGSS
jgi:hypothetical protein